MAGLMLVSHLGAEIEWHGDYVNRHHGVVNGDLEAYRQAELALIAARFALPGSRQPDVDRAIDLACRLLAGNLETPATVEVACLRYGTPLRDAEPVLRQMLREHGVPVIEPGSSDAERFRAALQAFGAGVIGPGEFSAVFYQMRPPWNEQDAIQRSLSLLLHELEEATTPEGQDEIVLRIRETALRASKENAASKPDGWPP
jgi:hypothetical protein